MAKVDINTQTGKFYENLHRKPKPETTTDKIKGWFAPLLREQSDLTKLAVDNSDKAREAAEKVWKVSQDHDEGQKALRSGGWKLFKRVVGTVLKDGDELMK